MPVDMSSPPVMPLSNALPGLLAQADRLRDIRRDIHAHPELCFQEVRTSELVADALTRWGVEVHRGLGQTGVVGVIEGRPGHRAIALRADMDALPMTERNTFAHASKHPGRMHACGHDGHTAMLLAAAQHLAGERDFDGKVVLVFQPAEEGGGGAAAMIRDGLFERFPVDAIFGMHNWPGMPAGTFAIKDGPCFASSNEFKIVLRGKGCHGAMPHLTVDPVVVCASIIMALQTIVSRNVSPQDMSVITVGSINAGKASNVIPDSAQMLISVRALNNTVRDRLERQIKQLIHAQAQAFGATAEIHYSADYPLLINDAEMTRFASQVATDWLGEGEVLNDIVPFNGSEDFAYFLQKCPGCYLIIGNGDGEKSCMAHDPRYDFNDDILMRGAGFWVKLTEAFLPLNP
mgnify:CR=1 FL=1